MSTICHNVTREDTEIAIRLGYDPQTKKGEFSPYRIANLRGIYDSRHPDNALDLSNIDDAVSKLSDLRAQLEAETAKKVISAGSHLNSVYKNLKEKFTAQERTNRVNMVAAMVSTFLDNAQKNNPGRSRREFLEGYTDDQGRKIGGEFLIFDRIYKELLNRMYQYASMEHGVGMEKADKIARVLENWDGIVAFTRIRLRETEGIRLGNSMEYAADATLDDLDENQLSDIIDAEESKRDHWQETEEMKSAFASIGARTRAILGMTPECNFAKDKNGGVIVINGVPKIEIVRDDLSFPVMGNPVSRHQQMLDVLRGMVDSRDMMRKLREAGKTIPWINPVVAYLENSPREITGFYTDFRKIFQEMSKIDIDPYAKRFGGAIKYVTTRLNKPKDVLSQTFKMRIANGRPLTGNSVYDSKGNVNWDNLRKVRETIMEWLKEPEIKKEEGKPNVFKQLEKAKSKYYSEGVTYLQKRDFIVSTSRALGLDMDADAAASLMRNGTDTRDYLKYLEEFFTYGVDNTMTDSERSKWLAGQNPASKQYSKVATVNSGRKTRTFEKVQRMNTLISKHREGLKVENRVPWRDSRGNSISLFSNMAPSYMASKFELIQSYVELNDKKGLRQFLKDNYLDSSFFMDPETGKIYNKWLEDLYNACDEKAAPLKASIGELFYYKRLLGTPEVNFEDFTSKQHAIDFLYEYISDEATNQGMKKDSALYPIFILGDSGTQKFVRQRRYTRDQIIDAMYNVYLQEKQRQKLVDATNKYLELEGGENNAIRDIDGFVIEPGESYSPIANYSKTGNEYTTLTFLNDKRYALEDEPTEDEIKRVIRAYLDNAYTEFKNNLGKLGVLESKKVDVQGKEQEIFIHLADFQRGKELDDALSDYFYNTKFATIEQLQMMTIDPGFYGKEVTITNPNTGEKMTIIRDRTKDLQKRYKEIHAPGNELDIYAIDPTTGQLVSPDATENCIYFDDIELDSENVHKEFMQLMKRLYGEKSGIYKKYKENTLTDGQGYRSLSSYRKVMIMYDTQWTEQMESAYREIMNIRSAYGRGEMPKEALEKLEKLAVIFKPIKPYMFTHEKIVLNHANDTQFIPVQHKYAEAVLIPELLPQGSKLRDMGYFMEDNNIDMIGSTKICKVGAYGSTKIDHLDQYDENILAMRRGLGDSNTNITNTDRLNHALNRAKVHKLSYSDYRIQTNVPNHVHQAQLFGTQVRKLIMAGTIKYDRQGHLIEPVDKNGHYRYERYVGYNQVNLGGKTGKVRINGRNLNSFYNSLIVANQLESFHKFQRTILNRDGLSEKFIQNVIGNTRESLDNIMAFSIDDDDFTMPLFEGSLEHDSAAFMLSLFKKMVNKQLINGGSAVQVSAMGIKDYSEDGGLNFVYDYEKDENGNYIIDKETNERIPSNILYIETEIPFDFSYVDENGNTVELNYDDYCNEDGTLKIDGDQSLLERDFPGITNIVAYRIPTERDYSMLNLKVVRCSRKTAGGTIKIPLECTTISGFDFDIDKLYFMRKEFVENKPIWQNLDLSVSQRQEIARQIQKDHPEFVKEIPAVTENSFTQSQLYDIFGVIYGDDPDFEGDPEIKRALKRERPEGDRTPLNRFWEDSPTILRMARSKGFENALEYKHFLVQDAADKLGYLPEHISIVKDGYLALDKEAIAKAGLKTGRVYREAADKLGIKLSENVNQERFINYDYEKSPLENDRVARNNMLLNLIQQRLMDPETLRSRTTPGGFVGASKSARIMRELNFGSLDGIEQNGKIDWNAMDKRAADKNADPEPNYDPSDPYTMILYNQANQIAGKLIGIFANHNTNHALASLLRTFKIAKGSEIEFAGHTRADGYGFDLLNAPEGVDVDLNLAEFLAASVDAVKDPVLKYLNFNTLTADAGALLARIGYNTLEIGLLFNQPIINEVCEYAFNNNLSLEEAIRDVYESYFYYKEEKTNRKIPRFGEIGIAGGDAVSKDKMATNIVNYRKDNSIMKTDSFAKEQLGILNLFNKIVAISGEVNQFVTSTKFTASNAVKSTFGDMYAQQMKVDNYVKSLKSSVLEMELSDIPSMKQQVSPIVNDDARLDTLDSMDTYQDYIDGVVLNPLAYEQCMFDLNRLAVNTMSRYFPYETTIYKTTREIMRNLTRGKYLDGDTINSIHRDLMVQLLSLQELSDFNGEKHMDTEHHGRMSIRDYYTKYFADDLYNYLEDHPEVKALPIFEYLIMEENPVTGETTVNVQGVGGLAPYQKEELRDSWSEFNKINPELSKGLFMFSFYKLGFDFSPVSFMNLAPTDVKQSIKVPGKNPGEEGRTYVEFLKQVLKGEIGMNYEYFVKQYIANHTDNKSLVYNVKSKAALSVIQPLVLDSNSFRHNDEFVLDMTTYKNKRYMDMFVLENDKEHNIMKFKPALKIGNSIYIASGNGAAFNESTTGSMTYERYDPIGSKHSKAYSILGLELMKNRSQTQQQEEKQEQNPEQGQSQGSTQEPEIGTTHIIPEPIMNPGSFSRDDVMDAMAEELIKGWDKVGYMGPSGNPLTVEEVKREMLSKLDDADVKAYAEAIRKACRDNKTGILMMNENGEFLQGC